MNDTLKALGMVRAFVRPAAAHGAEFDGMCASQSPAMTSFTSRRDAQGVCRGQREGNRGGGRHGGIAMAAAAAARSASPSCLLSAPTGRFSSPFAT